MRLMSDVPLGAFLSGGLDSSSVVAFMSRIMREPVKTFSVGYRDDPESSELEYARVVAKAFGTEHHEFILESGDFFDSLDMLLEHSEEPIVESAAVALYQLSKLARELVTVILSGEGGDEILEAAIAPLFLALSPARRTGRSLPSSAFTARRRSRQPSAPWPCAIRATSAPARWERACAASPSLVSR